MYRVTAAVTPPSRSTASRLTTSRSTASRSSASRSSALKYSFNFNRSWTPSASPKSLYLGIQLHLQTCSVTASEWISKFTWSRSPSISPNLPNSGLQVRTSMAYPTSFPNSHNHGLGVHLNVHLITASKCIAKLARLWHPSSHDCGMSKHIIKVAGLCPRSASLSSLDHSHQVHLVTCIITASKRISKLDPSWPASVSLILDDHSVVKRPRPYGIRREFLWNSGFCLGSITRGWEDMHGYPAVRNHTNCVDLWKLGMRVWDQEMGKIDCVFRMMRWCLYTPCGSVHLLYPCITECPPLCR